MARILGGVRTAGADRDVIIEFIVQITSEDVHKGEFTEGDFRKMLSTVINELKQKLVDEMLPIAREEYLKHAVGPEMITEAVQKAIVSRLAELILPTPRT